MRHLIPIVGLLLVLASPANAERKWHTSFYFQLLGAKPITTEQAPGDKVLGSIDGWTCVAHRIDLKEEEPGKYVKRSSISCVFERSGVEAEVIASCNVTADSRTSNLMELRGPGHADKVPVVVACNTKRE
jgi:hypothetical protein